MTFKNIITNLESLPPLSNTPFVIQQIYSCGSQNIDIIRLVKVIENDAVLAANILKMINAPIYGFSRKIASISQAVTLFGTDMVYGLVLKYAIGELLRADTEIYGLDNKRFNDVCQLQSTLMMQWYSRVDLRHAQIMTSLALIMESGKLVLANEVMKSSYIKKFTIGYKNAKNITEYEHNLLGTTTYYLSALLFEHWKFEPLYVEILKGLDFETEVSPKVKSYIDSIDVIRVAINVKNILTADSIKDACDIVEEIGLDVNDFKRIALRVKEQYNKVLINRLIQK
ncbi:MAG: histidine kinase [Sulfurimonas sp. RIFCSPLOWO2_12_FULL_36_74]|uniref:HDOD domain-containing protein n=1 Tax=Sulfurimonas sp. RIFCSPLOWO2_12_36_12 TaxID=1802253 RepID=UPI0008AD7A78|nr:HDOD domain-containing protein [Sulfurimonas sp. RIFCSPLOWO2_12_36_12]OHD97426.1 MAG: histidine kinase [Sulfurimonas sp. RIFCSPLOWO2_02_FULL_36_28]OHE01960.1 MAG: histidine kinase [Sulfurimonas sp. RIFCSPLOWO2_12_36_12]OHE04226.1 MAG: histidine kinase [Sulfurimonas sp. RIFCSPLOWO2_12_FULL_36_74]